MRSHFHISSLFLFTFVFALIAWVLTNETILGLFCSPIPIGIVFALHSRRSNPLMSAAIAGAFFIAAFTFTISVTELIGYLSYTEARPYYEEGFVNHVFIFPVVFCCIYCPAAALVSAFSGWVVVKCRSAWSAV